MACNPVGDWDGMDTVVIVCLHANSTGRKSMCHSRIVTVRKQYHRHHSTPFSSNCPTPSHIPYDITHFFSFCFCLLPAYLPFLSFSPTLPHLSFSMGVLSVHPNRSCLAVPSSFCIDPFFLSFLLILFAPSPGHSRCCSCYC